MRYFNCLVIVAILVVCALSGRGYLTGGSSPDLKSLQDDLKGSLDAFWQNHGTQVEVFGTPAQAEVHASVAFPAGTGPRQREQWMNALIAFVASRHPSVKLGSVQVVPLGGETAPGRPVPLACIARAEAAQRNWQTHADALFGPGKTLMLVDADRRLTKGNDPEPVYLLGILVLQTEEDRWRLTRARTRDLWEPAVGPVTPSLDMMQVRLLP